MLCAAYATASVMSVHEDPAAARRRREGASAPRPATVSEAPAPVPVSPEAADVLRLSRTAGNRAVAQLMAGRPARSRSSAVRLQRRYVLPEDQTVATAGLQEVFPGITIQGGGLDGKDDRFWETYMKMGSAPMTLEQFVRSLLLDFLPVASRTGVTIDLFSEGALPESGGGQTNGMGKGIRVVVATTAPLTAADPRPFGLTQVYKAVDGRVSVHVEAVVAVGKGREFVQSSLLNQSSLLDVRRITLTASMIGGSQEGVFAWARYGFTPSPEDWDSMRRWGLERVGRLPGDVKASIAKSLGDPSPKALRWIVHLSWKNPDAVKTFLDAMLSRSLSWHGDIDLADQSSRDWIRRYAGRVNDPAQYETLLPKLLEQGIPPPPLVVEAPVEKPKAAVSEEQMTQMVRLCVDAINGGEGTIQEVQTDYEHDYPGLLARVQAHPDLKGKAEVK
jgi:hypothetical protein